MDIVGDNNDNFVISEDEQQFHQFVRQYIVSYFDFFFIYNFLFNFRNRKKLFFMLLNKLKISIGWLI